MGIAIETAGLKKVYGDKIAVAGLTLQVRAGEAFGFLGPNGAGKTTSVKMLLGLVKPTSGSARLLDRPVTDLTARAQVGFLPEHFRFHDWLTATEFLTLHGKLFGIDSSTLRERIKQLLRLVELEEFAQKQLRTFSKGMLQRIGIAQALVNNPAIVFLDEPTSGLDPAGRRLVRDLLRDLRNKGTTVFLNSHFLSEVEITCDRVAFIKHGSVVQAGNLQELSRGQNRVTIRATGVTLQMLQELQRYGKEIEMEGEVFSMAIADESALPEIAQYLIAHGASLYSMTPHRITLEELFLEIIGKEGGL